MEPLNLEQTILKLFDVEGLKFGEFTVRTGEKTPVYIDMRVIWTYPEIVLSVSELMWDELRRSGQQFDAVCGLPYQGIPIASYLSTKYNIPMILKRQKPKTYGTCRFMEGHYKVGDRVMLMDDVVMTGGTLVDDIPVFRQENLEVAGAVTFIDRFQGGVERTKHIHGVDTISVVTLPEALDILEDNGKVTATIKENTLQHLRSNRFDSEDYGVKK